MVTGRLVKLSEAVHLRSIVKRASEGTSSWNTQYGCTRPTAEETIGALLSTANPHRSGAGNLHWPFSFLGSCIRVEVELLPSIVYT